MKFFHEPAAGRHVFDTAAAGSDGASAMRDLLLSSGLWRSFRSRPFGNVPAPDETPTAIVVMAVDSRPHAPNPADAADPAALDRGLDALLRLTEAPVFLVQPPGNDLAPARGDRLRIVKSDAPHPWGLPGFRVHDLCPPEIGRPVWDIHAEEVAAIGTLLETGLLPETRLVSVAGPALTRGRLLRCQPGADLRGLCYGFEKPGAHRILSGSALDGHEMRWLGDRDRQVTVLDPGNGRSRPHWFLSALRHAARPLPLIPTAALDQAMGVALPVLPFLRALSAGDAETFKRLGGLCFLEEDLALVDYVANADPPFAGLIRDMLNRIEAEEAA